MHSALTSVLDLAQGYTGTWYMELHRGLVGDGVELHRGHGAHMWATSKLQLFHIAEFSRMGMPEDTVAVRGPALGSVGHGLLTRVL